MLIFQYISREVMNATIVNKPLTHYPQVKLFVLIFARALVEIVTGFLGLSIIVSLLIVLGADPRPADSCIAITAYLAAISLGIGVGVVNTAIVSFFPGWLACHAIFNILINVASSMMFIPSFFPEKIYYWLKHNPALQFDKWMRAAYYHTSGLQIDYLYVIKWSFPRLSLGLQITKHIVSKRS